MFYRITASSGNIDGDLDTSVKQLMSGPTVVMLLGSLMSLRRDFSPEDVAPVGGFKCIKHPLSYRASALEVSNRCTESFLLADSGTLQIEKNMEVVPISLRRMTSYLKPGKERLAQKYVPIKLKHLSMNIR